MTQAAALFATFQRDFYAALMKVKKVSNMGILLLELDMACYEEVGVAGRC